MNMYLAKLGLVSLCVLIALTSCNRTSSDKLTTIEEILVRNEIMLYYDGNLKHSHEVEIAVVGIVDDEIEAAVALNALAAIKKITTFSATSGNTPSASFFEALETMEAVHDLRIGPIDDGETIGFLDRFPNPSFVELISVTPNVSWTHLPVWEECEVLRVDGWVGDEFLERLQYFSSLKRVYFSLSEEVSVDGIRVVGALSTLTKIDIAEVGQETSPEVIELLPKVLSDRVQLLWDPVSEPSAPCSK